jgi:hypothetical protein
MTGNFSWLAVFSSSFLQEMKTELRVKNKMESVTKLF